MIAFHHVKTGGLGIVATLALAFGCSDDGSGEAGASGTDGTGTGQTESGESGESESETVGAETLGGETETETETGDETDTGGPIACEAEQNLGDWLFMLDQGIFPNDVPTDVDESCTVVAAPDQQLGLDCPFGEFTLILELTPAPVLPAPGTNAQVRLHHEPGWLLWPDLWISVEVEGGDLFGFQSSSVVTPTLGTYAVPGDPSLTASECGPFVLGDLGGEDPCGEQLGHELEFLVDGQTVSAWHGTHLTTAIDGRAFEAWINTARQYTAPPEFCDISPTWYSVVTRRESAG